MYNRYIPNGTSYTRVPEPDGEPIRPQAPRQTRSAPPPPPPREEPRAEPRPQRAQEPGKSPLSSLFGGNLVGGEALTNLFSGWSGGKKNTGLSGILEKLKLDDIDTGDILLILILLFLFRDGDDMELVITLGLILLLGLGDKEKED